MSKSDETAVTEIERAIASRYPIVYLLSWEEERMAQMLQNVSESVFEDDRPLVLWSGARGFYNRLGDLEKVTDPHEALQYVASASNDAVYLLEDFPAFLENNNTLIRQMRDLYNTLTDRNTYIFLSHPVARIPEELKKEIFLIDLGLPGEKEIVDYINRLLALTTNGKTLPDDWIYKFASAMKGLALNEVRHLIFRLIQNEQLSLEDALEEIYQQKAQVLLKESCLRAVPRASTMIEIGGLENLKQWVSARAQLFTKKAFDAGVPMPNGVLFMGVSGCGKSLAAKTIASAWDLQLVRLDMNLILSGMYGSPEYAFDRAARVAESIAPLVLWIDEIENAFGYDEGPSSRGNINIFSSFLTWMQEKPPSVFVAATANRIQKLPAEMIRKGRFDQLFFLDLPTEQEREEIFRIHIQKNGGDLEEFDVGVLATLTQGRSGAEIQQAVIAARVDAFAENRAFTQRDISRNSSQMVPLSETMHEQIKQLRDWSYNRATPASKKKRL